MGKEFPNITPSIPESFENIPSRGSLSSRIVVSPLLILIAFYRRFLSPLFPSVCRFYPTCSDYTQQVLRSHGLVTGGWLAVRRIARCHPWHPGGYDPPPPPHQAGH